MLHPIANSPLGVIVTKYSAASHMLLFAENSVAVLVAGENACTDKVVENKELSSTQAGEATHTWAEAPSFSPIHVM